MDLISFNVACQDTRELIWNVLPQEAKYMYLMTCKNIYQIHKQLFTKQYVDIVNYAIESDNINIINPNDIINDKHLQTMIIYNRMNMLEHLSNRYTLDSNCYEIAARYCHIHIIKWLSDKKVQMSYYILIGALRSGNLDIVLWVEEHTSFIYNESSYHYTQSLDVVKWLYTKNIPLKANAFKRYITMDNLNIVKWIDELNIIDKWSFVISEIKSIEMAKYLHANKYQLSRGISTEFVIKNDLDSLKWIYNNIGIDESTYLMALYSCSIDILNWLIEISDEDVWLNSRLLINAHDEKIFKWLRGIPHDKLKKLPVICPWDNIGGIVIRNNIYNDNLELIQWSIEQGCPLDVVNTFITALDHENINIIKYIYNIAIKRMSIEEFWNNKNICTSVRYSLNLDTIKWVNEEINHDIITYETYLNALEGGCLNIIEYLHKKYFLTNRAYFLACESHNQKICEYVFNNIDVSINLKSEGEYSWLNIIDKGLSHHTEFIIKWLLEHNCPQSFLIIRLIRTNNLTKDIIEFISSILQNEIKKLIFSLYVIIHGYEKYVKWLKQTYSDFDVYLKFDIVINKEIIEYL